MSFKSVAEFLALTGPDAPTTAERGLITATQAGDDCFLCNRVNPTRPTTDSDETRIRAALLRLLINGGSTECGLHTRGVSLFGGWIDGELDLAWCKARGKTALRFCHFAEKPRLEGARFKLLSLDGSAFPKGLFAQGAQVQSDLFLRTITASGTVDLGGTKIGGQLSCIDARFDGGEDEDSAQQWALNAQGVETGDSLFLSTVTASGTVDLAGAKIGGQLDCDGAQFDGGKDKNGAQQTALNSQGVETGRDLFLRTITASGTIDVAGAKIGGQLDCIDAQFDGGKDKDGAQQEALNAQGVETGQDLFVRSITASGTVDMSGARIGGQLDCTGAQFDGGKDKDGAQQWALNTHRMRVTAGFYFRDVTKVIGQVNLTAANVGDLVDDAKSWPLGTNDLILDGFTYDRTDGPTTLAARRKWLAAGSQWQGEFYPQPYTQFARVLRQMGHGGEARKVLIEAAQVAAKTFEKQHRARRRLARAIRRFSAKPDEHAFAKLEASLINLPATIQDEASATAALFVRLHNPPPERSGAPPALDPLTMTYARQDFRNRMLARAASSRLAILFSRVKHGFLHRIVGHGHAPQRAIWAILISTGFAAVWYAYAYGKGAMVPNSDVILTSFNWWLSMQDQAMSPTAGWTASGTAQHYETFYSLAYAFDVIVPLVDIGQKSTWSATTVTWTGWSTRVLTMILEVWGWIVTALGAAAVTGLVQRNQPD